MTPAEARQLVLDEFLQEQGVVVLIRTGDDPGRERMKRLLAALRVLFDSFEGDEATERQLAAALHGLASYTEWSIDSWTRAGRKWRPQLVEQELPALLMAVESISLGEWVKAMS